jgi:hypothetical protein
MKLKIDLDFCVIQSPYSVGLKNIIFVTYRGANRIEENLCLEEDYENLKYILGKYGFQEIEYCTFESANNYNMHIEEAKMRISEHGLRYSKTLERIIAKEIQEYHNEMITLQKSGHLPSVELPNTIQIATENFNEIGVKTKHKIPEVGGKITLYFYLFLQCNFINDKDCVLELVGDLYSKQDNNNRNYLHITKSDFVRIESNESNIVILQSTKSYFDFLNEINFLHKGNFRFSKQTFNQHGDMTVKSKDFVYNIMEIKKNINPQHKIVVEVNANKYYDDMLTTSKVIRKELSIEQKKVIPLEVLVPEIVKLKNKFNDKMLSFASEDEFEKAGNLKKDINFLENKIKIIDAMEEKHITKQEYLKAFCLNS